MQKTIITIRADVSNVTGVIGKVPGDSQPMRVPIERQKSQLCPGDWAVIEVNGGTYQRQSQRVVRDTVTMSHVTRPSILHIAYEWGLDWRL